MLQGFLLAMVTLVAIFLGVIYYFQNALIYPARFPPDSRVTVMRPDEFDMPHYEEITLITPDHVKLKAFLIQRPTKEETLQATTLLYLHANAGNMGHRLPIARLLYHRLKCNIFMLSYRGYGLSEGSPSEHGLKIDAQAALDFIRQYPELKNTKVILYGQSIGGAVAISLASKNAEKIHGLILENTFLNLRSLIPFVMPYLRFFTFLCHQRWESDKEMGKITCPILFLSGLQDELVPASMMKTLYESSTSAKKKMVTFSAGTHNDTCIQPGYFTAIINFWNEYIDANVVPKSD